MTTRIAVTAACSFLLCVSLVCASEPTADELDVPILSVHLQKSDLLVSTCKGIYWADLTQKKWQKLKLPAGMPLGGEFGTVPKESAQILYFVTEYVKHQKPGLYGSKDSGRSWYLISQRDYCEAVTMLDNGHLFMVSKDGGFRGKTAVETSKDMGKSWRDIKNNSFGTIVSLFPDPDHPGLICLSTDALRSYVNQAEDDRYQWKVTRYWDWYQARPAQTIFERSYSASDKLYTFRSTLHNYFDYDFGSRPHIPALDIHLAKDNYAFQEGENVVVPISVRFLEDLRMRTENGVKEKATVEKLIDHPMHLGVWGIRVEKGTERKSIRPSTAVLAGGDWDEETIEKAQKMVGDAGWKTVEFSSSQPYKRDLEISRLYDFSKPGEYRVQLVYDSMGAGNYKLAHWVGEFTSQTFKVTIKPRD